MKGLKYISKISKTNSVNTFGCNNNGPKIAFIVTVKPVLSGHSERRPKLVFKTDYRLMQVKSIAECSKGSILQYFRPSLSYHLPSYHLPLRPLFCLVLSSRLIQVLLYLHGTVICSRTRKYSVLVSFSSQSTTCEYSNTKSSVAV